MTGKECIRAESLAMRRAMTRSEHRTGSEAIAQRLWILPGFANASSVMTYVSSKDNEVDTRNVIGRLLAEGRGVWVPATRPGRRMAWFSLHGLDELEENAFGIFEPKRREGEGSPPDDAPVLTPGLAFSPHCRRIGYGAGYFDRFLADHAGTAIGLAFQFQIRDDVPSEPHDIPLDVIVTESAVYRRE